MKEGHFMGIVRNGLMKRLGKSPEAYLSEALKLNIGGSIGVLPLIPIILNLLPKILKLFKGGAKEAGEITDALKADGEPDIAEDFKSLTQTARHTLAKSIKSQKPETPEESAAANADNDGTGIDTPVQSDKKLAVAEDGTPVPSTNARNTKIC
jgi:hypothetical protein